MNVRICQKSALAESHAAKWADPSRRPYVEGEQAYIPVKDGYPFDVVLPERAPPYRGRGYQRMGDTLLLHGDEPTADQLADLIAFEQPTCILFAARHDGVMRLPEAKVLFGTPHEVTFREAGISYTLNPSKVMFSQGNRNEKIRIRNLVRPGETVADMFAGIGYFTLSAALSGAHVHAMELNPESFAYLRKNITANGVENLVKPELGDCRDHLQGTYDRILMGHFDAVEFLPQALLHSRPGTTLHVHGLGDRSAEVARAVGSAGFRYNISEHKVKKYASRVWHCVWDVNLI